MTVIQLSLILVYVCVLVIKTCDISSRACEMFGFGSDSKGEHKPSSTRKGTLQSIKLAHPFLAGVYLFFIFFGLSVLALILVAEAVVMFNTFKHDMSVRAIRISGSGKLPEMSLTERQKYHLFVSRAPWRRLAETESSRRRARI